MEEYKEDVDEAIDTATRVKQLAQSNIEDNKATKGEDKKNGKVWEIPWENIGDTIRLKEAKGENY